jgi:hypothetical protein
MRYRVQITPEVAIYLGNREIISEDELCVVRRNIKEDLEVNADHYRADPSRRCGSTHFWYRIGFRIARPNVPARVLWLAVDDSQANQGVLYIRYPDIKDSFL